MKLLQLILFTTLAITKCTNPMGNESPLSINNTKTDNHQRFPGTRTFIIPPKDFQLEKQMSRFSKKDGSAFIMTYETNATAYDPDKFSIKACDSLGEKLIEWHKVKVQNYDGVMLFGEVYEEPAKRKAVLVFGDKSFQSMVIVRYPKEDEQMRGEIKNSFKTIFYDNTFELNPIELANFDIDLSNTNFKINQTMTNLFTFTPNGKGDPFNDVFQTVIVIQQLQRMGDSTATKNYALKILNSLKTNYKINEVNSKETVINGNYAYESIIKAEFKGKPNIIYQIVLTDSKSTIFFTSSAYEDFDSNLKTFKALALTLRSK